jgi:hypothetical protein|tara:strand:- start:135 stop:449 length:315 start_codon:yes stop_codon:yes gene_type:complete
MLSHNYRMRLQHICSQIASNLPVNLDDMIWASKLAKANTTANDMLRKARKKATQHDSLDSLDNFMSDLNLGDPDPQNHLTSLNSIDDFVNWFKQDKPDDWRQRD